MGDKGETEHPPPLIFALTLYCLLVSPVFHSNAPLLFNLRPSAPAKWLWLVDGGTSTPPSPHHQVYTVAGIFTYYSLLFWSH
jgi:hypothetical protein